MNYVSRPFYLGSSLVVALVGFPLFCVVLMAGGGKVEEEFLPLLFLGEAVLLYGFVVLLVLYYKMWKVLPPEAARTTPGKAVGFMFIPIFNLYWMFQALWGWSKDFNRYVEQRGLASPRVSEGVALAVCVLSIIGTLVGWIGMAAGVPGLGMIFGVPVYVLLLVFIYQACTSLNALPAEAIGAAGAAAGGVAGAPAPSQGRGIASLVLGILSLAIPYLGIVCGIVAIVLARAQRRKGPNGLATAGLVLGIIGTCLYGLIILLVVVMSITYGMS